jgi:hypothetical protein
MLIVIVLKYQKVGTYNIVRFITYLLNLRGPKWVLNLSMVILLVTSNIYWSTLKCPDCYLVCE